MLTLVPNLPPPCPAFADSQAEAGPTCEQAHLQGLQQSLLEATRGVSLRAHAPAAVTAITAESQAGLAGTTAHLQQPDSATTEGCTQPI